MSKIRLSDQSIANIKVATKAEITKKGTGYQVTVKNQYGSEPLKDGSGIAHYPTKKAAQAAVTRHNQSVKIEVEKVKPSPSMLPPK